ncbi:MAG: endonuclease/exonuclease/phosphatase family protein [Rubrivivax sp.]|nr:endonuclease/exonuclease/phosphatase family protein [Rubrivivax sp.]
MYHITDLRSVTKEIAKGLLVLKDRIEAAKIPSSKLDETFNLATWNIREFGRKPRTQAAIHYIAEILGQFDLIGVVELRDDLRDLRRVLDVLGPYWRAVYSDAVLDAGGNRERVAYVYDKRQIVFNGMASAAFPRRTKKGTEWIPEFNWWRPPYVASFKSGNFDFVVVTTHIRWGDSEAGREPELRALAQWVADKKALFEKDKRAFDDQDLFAMGDFNIPSVKSKLFSAVTSMGLMVPSALAKSDLGSNLKKDKRYDQILHLPHYPENFTNKGGVVDFFAGNHKPLFPALTKDAFSYQMSDHLPLWIQVNTDVDERRLDQIIQG